MKTLGIIYNPNSGRTAAGKSAITEAFDRTGCKLFFSKISDDSKTILQNIRNKKVDVIVAAGGDGTVNFSANLAVRANLPLAILPIGTLNHFAKDLGLPLKLKQAALVAATSHYKKVDYVTVNDMSFVNNASIGLYPTIVLQRELHEDKFGKWPAAILASIRSSKRLKTIRLAFTIGNKDYIYKTPLVFVGNNSYNHSRLGFSNRTSLSRGELYLYVVRANRLTALLRVCLNAFFGKRLKDRDFLQVTTEEVTITSNKQQLDVALDGEVHTLLTPLHFVVHPQKLSVAVSEEPS